MVSQSAGALSVPTFAEGGTIAPGALAYIGEHGPNARMIRAGGEPIMVTPNDVTTGGGNVHVSMPITVDARGAQLGAADQIQAMMRREVPGIAVAAVRQAQSYRRL